MIVAILLGMVAPVQAAPPPAPDDIIVIAERLKRLRFVTRKDRKTGVTRCVFKRRSGDPRLDERVCNATLACIEKVATAAEIKLCMAPAMMTLVPGAQWSATTKDKR